MKTLLWTTLLENAKKKTICIPKGVLTASITATKSLVKKSKNNKQPTKAASYLVKED